jgi:hypothetical protein
MQVRLAMARWQEGRSAFFPWGTRHDEQGESASLTGMYHGMGSLLLIITMRNIKGLA